MDKTFDYIDDISLKTIDKQLGNDPVLAHKNYSTLFEPRFTVSQQGISRQELLTWKQKGLIPGDISSEGGGWTRVSFFEFCWIRIIAELRIMGVPLDVIKKLSNHILEPDSETFITMLNAAVLPENSQSFPLKNAKPEIISEIMNSMPDFFANYLKKNFNRLVQLVLKALIISSDFVLFITLDGEYLVVGPGAEQQEGFKEAYNKVLSQPFYSIPINLILDGFYNNDKIKAAEKSTMLQLTENEVKVIEFLRKEGVKEVRIKMDAQSGTGIALIEVVEEKNIEKMQNKVEKLIQKGKFHNIKISIANGNVIYIEETTKHKVKS